MKDIVKKNYEEGFRSLLKRKPEIEPIFDVKNPKRQSFVITPQIADYYNLRGHLKEFVSKAKFSTAGIRSFIDILHSENPEKMYNDMFMALLIETEAEFLVDVHKEIKKRLVKIKDLKSHCKIIREKMGEKNVEVVEKIYGMKLEKILDFLKKNIVKIVGGEVRVHTAKYCEMEARILAGKGIYVIVPERYENSVAIYMYSFLTFILGTCGATHYTSSHSSNYVYGRKNLAPDGAQLLPEVYENYIKILERIINREIYSQGRHKVVMAEARNKKIMKNLKYDYMAKLFTSIINVSKQDVKTINEAAKKGHKIVLNCLNGSTWKTLEPMLDELGIDKNVFDLMWEEEDAFFNAGYLVDYDKQKDEYNVDHYGIDTTYTKVIPTIPYIDRLKGYPVGTMVFECDPDSDRFVLKQIMDKKAVPLLDEFGVDYLELERGKILAMPMPNKIFLALDIIDKEIIEGTGKWKDYTSLYYITYVSSRAWSEFGDALYPYLVRVMEMVGFKNLTAMQRLIEDWWFNRPDEYDFAFIDQLGRKIEINRDRQIRIHSKEEESGGRVGGTSEPCVKILGQRVLAMPEKSSADATLSVLTFASKEYLTNSKNKKYELSNNYLVMNFLKNRFKKYGLKSKIDIRLDLVHGQQGAIALMPYEKQQEAMKEALAKKENFNNFAFSLGKAVRDGKIDIEKAREVLIRALPDYAETWKCLDDITITEEKVVGGEMRPEGVPMIFKLKKGKVPLFTEVDFRPSGTDPLKSKIYIDAEKLSPEKRKEIESFFNKIIDYDFYNVLDEFGIKPVIPRNPVLGKINLKIIRLGKRKEL